MERAAKKQKLSIEANNTSVPKVPAAPRPHECTATNVMDTCDVPIYNECETHKALSEQAKQDAKQPAEPEAKQSEQAKQPAEQATWKAVELPRSLLN